MPEAREEPGIGMYECVNCGQTVKLDDEGDQLPPCPKCHKTEFKKVSG